VLDIINTSKKLPKRHKPQYGVEYPHDIHRYARYLREVDGLTWPALSEKVHVPERTLQSWSEKEVWKKKGESASQIEQFTRERFLELAAAADMPKRRAVKLLVDGMTKPSVSIEALEMDEKGDIKKKMVQEPDYATRQKYQKDYWTLVGLMGGKGGGMDISPGAGGTVNIQVIIPEKSEE
jgi:hypothetical protein